jgi:hypothetical protein
MVHRILSTLTLKFLSIHKRETEIKMKQMATREAEADRKRQIQGWAERNMGREDR